MRRTSDDFLADVKRARLGGPTAKVVMLTLASYAGLDAEGAWSCYPGQERIAYEAEMSDRQVRRVLTEFEAQGLIRRTPRKRPDGRGRTSDRITLIWDAIKALGLGDQADDQADDQPDKLSARSADQPDNLSGKSGATNRTSEHDQPDTDGTTNRTLVSRELQEELPVKKTPLSTAVDAVASFETFWTSWPKRRGLKVDKAPALAKWRRMNDEERSLATAGAVNYAAASKPGGPAGAMDAVRWLKGAKWVDWQADVVVAEDPKVRSAEAQAKIRADNDRVFVEEKTPRAPRDQLLAGIEAARLSLVTRCATISSEDRQHAEG